MATIVFSHGFGTRADARGMFTQIADSFPQHHFVFIDYNKIYDDGNIEVAPLQVQAQKLQQAIDEQSEEVIVIAHSQGCIIAGMIDPSNVKKAILLAPPVEMSMQRVLHKLMNKPGAVIDLDGLSKLPRGDGTTTYLSKEYIESVDTIQPLELYAHLAGATETTLLRCLDDEVLGLTNLEAATKATVIDIAADHDFTGKSRESLLTLLTKQLDS